MDAIFTQYEERCKRLRMSPGWIDNLHRAVKLIEGHDPRKITEWELEEIMAGTGLGAGTQRTRLSALRAAYRYALRRGVFDRDPTEHVQLMRAPTPRIRIIPNDVLRLALRACPADLEILAHLLAYTGMRKGEIRQLRWEDVNLVQQTIHVRPETSKTKTERYVPIHPALGEVMTGKWRMGRRVAAIYHGNVKAIHPDYSPHDYRRTVATSLMANGVPEPVIDRVLGWAPNTTARRHYFHVAGPSLHEAILKLYADDPI